MSFVHFHRHSEFSLLDGTGTAEQYAQRAVDLGQPALAITDHGTMAGALHHIVACERAGVFPIVGMEAYWRWSRTEPMQRGEKRYHLVLLAKNQDGFHNLMRMSSEAYRSGMCGFSGVKRPCVDWDLLSRYSDGVIASTACLSSPLASLIRVGGKADAWLKKLVSIFGDDVMIEIMPDVSQVQIDLNFELVKLAQEFSLPLIATTDAHYPYPEWLETQDVLLMVNTGQSHLRRKAKRDSGEDVYTMGGHPTLYMMSRDEVVQAFAQYQPTFPAGVVNEAVANTVEMSKRFSPVSVSKENKLPKAHGVDTAVLVRTWCAEGMQRIGKDGDAEYRQRLDYELGVLEDNGVVDYFYIIGDMVREMRSRGMRIGAGRGSAAGCLVSYLIGITGVDPIAHNLIFERFLNPSRKALPDIDIDFQHDRRQEVIDYLKQRWGSDRVVGVAAYQRFGMRSAITAVAQVWDVPFDVVKKLTKGMDDDKRLDLATLRGMSPELDTFATAYPDVWKHATRLEGQARTQSRHPAGVVVTERPVHEYMPLCRSKDGEMVTAWSESEDMRVITDYGFLKIDVLATDGLTIQGYALDLIKKRHGIVPDLDALPFMSDPEADISDLLEPFGKGQTLGIFQFHTKPLTQLLRQIKPRSFADLAAANALIRPGPLQGGMAKSYAARLNGREDVAYWHPALKKSLERTYGLMTYQEQVMEVVKEIGGLTMAEADDVRRAVSKKDLSQMSGMRGQFIAGCVKVGMDESLAADIWDKIVHFAGYAFNASHAVAYAAQGAQDMWLKVNYPLEFYAAFITFEPDQSAAAVREASQFGVTFLPPSINLSEKYATIDGDAVRLGLEGIKYVGGNAVAEIMEKRPFTSYDDFHDRVTAKRVNARVKNALVQAGAFDWDGQREDWSDDARAVSEIEFLGFSVVPRGVEHHALMTEKIWPEFQVDLADSGSFVMVGGEVTNVKKIMTKKGDAMGFVDLSFGADQFSVTVFPKEWLTYQSLWAVGQSILVWGKKDGSRDVVICDQATAVSELAAKIKEAAGGV